MIDGEEVFFVFLDEFFVDFDISDDDGGDDDEVGGVNMREWCVFLV